MDKYQFLRQIKLKFGGKCDLHIVISVSTLFSCFIWMITLIQWMPCKFSSKHQDASSDVDELAEITWIFSKCFSVMLMVSLSPRSVGFLWINWWWFYQTIAYPDGPLAFSVCLLCQSFMYKSLVKFLDLRMHPGQVLFSLIFYMYHFVFF